MIETALGWTQRLVAISIALSAIELLVVRAAWSDTGVFRWSTLRQELAPRWSRRVLDPVFGARGFTIVVAAQLALALALPWVAHPAASWLLLVTTLAIAFRFRGSYAGGSDAMTVVVLVGLAIAPWSPRAGLGYIAAQLVLSYVVAGVGKLADPAWRAGRALPALLALPQYAAPARVRRLIERPAIARAASFAVLGFELGFPLALLGPVPAAIAIGLGLAFHVTNAVVLGLNRFVWAWLAAYPALIYWAVQ